LALFVQYVGKLSRSLNGWKKPWVRSRYPQWLPFRKYTDDRGPQIQAWILAWRTIWIKHLSSCLSDRITGKRQLQKSLWFLYLCTHYVERYNIAQRVYK
jgi:hypothetical protein